MLEVDPKKAPSPGSLGDGASRKEISLQAIGQVGFLGLHGCQLGKQLGVDRYLFKVFLRSQEVKPSSD